MSTDHSNHKARSVSLRCALLGCALLTPSALQPGQKIQQKPLQAGHLTNNNDARDVAFEAVKRGDMYTLKVVALASGIYKGTDSQGKTLLHHAVYHKGDLLDYLINTGIDLNKKDTNGRTALLQALYAKNVDAARVLITKGALVDPADKEGNTALHVALADHKLFARLIPALIKKSASVNTQNTDGRTPLMVLVKAPQERNATQRVIRLAQLLIDNGAQVNKTDKEGTTALHLAVNRYHGAEEVADLLLRNNAHVNAVDSNGDTPLMKARSLELFSLLLGKGAHVNARNFKGVTPLMVTAADPYSEDALKRVQILLARKALINAQDKDGLTALHYALEHGNNAIASELITAGASVTLRDKDSKTPLHRASYHYKENPLPLELILKKGANINAKDKLGNTPLHYLVIKESFAPELIKLFYKHGADVNARNAANKTPLAIASTYRRYVDGYNTDDPGFWITGEEAVKALKECGARV